MVPEGVDDGEGDLLAAVRARGGPRCRSRSRSTSTATSRATWSPTPTLLHGYKTYPHVDMAERGREAAERLADVIGRRIRPTVAYRQPPILPPIGGQLTARGPMRRLYDLADAMEQRPRSLGLDLRRISAGRHPRRGPRRSTWPPTTTRPSPSALADRARRRGVGAPARVPAHRAAGEGRGGAGARADGRPIVLADIADNTGGGAAGDGTEILRELLRVGARGRTVACLWDAAAVHACAGRGRRRTVTLEVGGKVDDQPRRAAPRHRHGAHALRRPLRVQRPDDARARGPAGSHRGAGRQRREGDPDHLPLANPRSGDDPLRGDRPPLGEDPGREVHRSTIARPSSPSPGDLEVDAPGLSSSNLGALRVQRIRRPIFPLDPDLYEAE